MRRLVIDTNVYIDWFNAGRHEDILFQRDAIKYLSAVVQMEMRAGAFSVRDRRLVRRVEAAFQKAGRILVPPRAVFAEAGDVLRLLQGADGRQLPTRSLVADVLIALSARSIGAAVVTLNARDYRAIQAVRFFQLQVVSRAGKPPTEGAVR
jgi:predicted nucleic acid-binding protein